MIVRRPGRGSGGGSAGRFGDGYKTPGSLNWYAAHGYEIFFGLAVRVPRDLGVAALP